MATFKHGSKATIWVDTTGNTNTDISQYVNSISFNMPLDTAPIDTMGGLYKQSVTGLYGIECSIQGNFDPTIDGQLSALVTTATSSVGENSGPAGAITIKYRPQGNASGSRQFTFEAWITSYEVSTDTGGAGTFSASFSGCGPISTTTVP